MIPSRSQAAKPKHIGIVACSAEGAALCFREIAAYSLKLMGEHMHPQVTLSCIALGEWMPAFNRGDYAGVAEFMLRLSAADAGFHAPARPRSGRRSIAMRLTRMNILGQRERFACAGCRPMTARSTHRDQCIPASVRVAMHRSR
jgi:hypothetical protein